MGFASTFLSINSDTNVNECLLLVSLPESAFDLKNYLDTDQGIDIYLTTLVDRVTARWCVCVSAGTVDLLSS